jgi:HEAT repeat protein
MIPENEKMQQRRDDPRSTDELIKLALNEVDEDAAWAPVVVLHFRATPEVLAQVRGLCVSEEAKERTLGANVLGQLGVPDRAFPEECFQTLSGMLTSENDPEVLEAIAVAYGHLNDVRAVELLAPLSSHADADVRMSVVHAMSRHDDALAIRSLIQLSKDEDEDVRDWATFGLGSLIETDTPEIREALIERLVDKNNDARGEALVGLARRKDSRVFTPLFDELTSASVGLLALEDAEELGDPRLVPALMLLKEEWKSDEDRHVGRLHDALLSCLPNGGVS